MAEIYSQAFTMSTRAYHSYSPDQSLDSKSDNSREQEERGDQDVEQRQSREGVGGTGTSCVEEGMRHECLQDAHQPCSRLSNIYRSLRNKCS